MKITREDYVFVPVDIKLETLKEYVILHDLLCFCLEEKDMCNLSRLNKYIRDARNDSRPDIDFADLENIITRLKDGLYKVGGRK